MSFPCRSRPSCSFSWVGKPILDTTEIFGGFFHCSPVGLVEKVPGNGNWHMIRHLSKQDCDRNSTNDWLDLDDFPTTYFTSTWVTQFVSFSLLFTPLHFHFVPHLHSICGVRSKCTALLNWKLGRFRRVRVLASAHGLRLTTYYHMPKYFG